MAALDAAERTLRVLISVLLWLLAATGMIAALAGATAGEAFRWSSPWSMPWYIGAGRLQGGGGGGLVGGRRRGHPRGLSTGARRARVGHPCRAGCVCGDARRCLHGSGPRGHHLGHCCSVLLLSIAAAVGVAKLAVLAWVSVTVFLSAARAARATLIAAMRAAWTAA